MKLGVNTPNRTCADRSMNVSRCRYNLVFVPTAPTSPSDSGRFPCLYLLGGPECPELSQAKTSGVAVLLSSSSSRRQRLLAVFFIGFHLGQVFIHEIG